MENRDPDATVLRPPRALRALAWAVAALAALLAALAALLLLTGVIIPGCCAGIAAGVLTVVVTPLLAGRAEVRGDALITRADPAKTYTLPWREISAVVTRRRLLTEVVAVRRGDVWLEVGAPRRWRFRPDPAFTAAARDIARRARADLDRGGRRTPTGKLVLRTVLALVYVAAFVTLDPVWHSPLWPGRQEASDLPQACPVLAPAAGMQVRARRQALPRTGEACTIGGTLSLRADLYTYRVGDDGGIEQAEPRFRAAADGGRAVPGLGDEAAVRVSAPPGEPDRPGLVKVVARRANVVVQLTYRPRTARAPATATAERLTRAYVARIVVR